MRTHVCYYRQAETGETNLLFDESVCPNDLALLAVCDTLGKGSASGGAAGEEAFLTGRVRVYEETAARGLPDGSMLLAAGMEPGPQLAEALAAARRRALTGETAEEAVQNVLRKRKGPISTEFSAFARLSERLLLPCPARWSRWIGERIFSACC